MLLNVLLLALSFSTGIADNISTTNEKTQILHEKVNGVVIPRALTNDGTMQERQRRNERQSDNYDYGYSGKGTSGPNDGSRKQGKKAGQDNGGASRKGKGKGGPRNDSRKEGKKGPKNGNSNKGRGKKGDHQAGGVVTITPTLAPVTLSPGATPVPTSPLTPEQIACNFLSVASLTECRAKLSFDPIYGGDSTNGTTIPTEIGILTQLTYLSFFLTHMTGSIPASLTALTQLTELRLDYNEFTGSIPSSLSTLTKLTTLTLDGTGSIGTGLTGTIPSSFASLTQLTWLTFNYNQLTGTIPNSFSTLTELRRLEFSANLLTGSIPSTISSLSNLVTFNVDNNTLTGSIPYSFCSIVFFTRIDCGEIECYCCTDSENRLCP